MKVLKLQTFREIWFVQKEVVQMKLPRRFYDTLETSVSNRVCAQVCLLSL